MVSRASANPNPNVSNGTCYSAENTKADSKYIPCGNVALSHWPCCYAGDVCLSFDDANACYDADSQNTYLAGCTDIGFNDRSCPRKSTQFNSQQWVAIQHCEAGTGNNDTKWGGCKVASDSVELTVLPHRSCDPYCSSYIYEGSSALPAFATLPASTRSTITWTNGFNPTKLNLPVTASSDVSGSSTTATSAQTDPGLTAATITPTQTDPGSTAVILLQPSSTSTPEAADDASNGLSVGAKTGIGVGVAVVALLIVAVLVLGVVWRRKRSKAGSSQPGQRPAPSQPRLWLTGEAQYVGYKSELPADESLHLQRSVIKSELAADEPRTALSHLSPQPRRRGLPDIFHRRAWVISAIMGLTAAEARIPWLRYQNSKAELVSGY